MFSPRLEYVSHIWNPNQICEITQVESVQRSFTAKIKGLENQDYWQRLETVQRRRERYIIILMWKIFKSMAPNNLQFEFKNHIRLCPQCRRRI